MQKTVIQTDIAGLRALSVVIVVLYHFKLRPLSGGFIGVDIFFVLSGYLMTRIILSDMLAGRFQYGLFLLRRGLRIVPALLAVILFLLLAGAVLLPPTDLASLAEQSLRAVLFISNNYYAGQQGYFSAGIDDRWLLHTWSLSVEWQFYMLYPLLVWIGLRLAGQRDTEQRQRIVMWWLTAVCLASLALCVLLDHQNAFFSVATRSWQMIAGGLVYMSRSARWLQPLQGALLSYAGLAVIAVAAWVVNVLQLEQQWPGWYALMPVVGACLVLMARWEHNPLLNNRLAQTLGNWSYSIYLWHWPIVIAFTITGLMEDKPRLAKVAGVSLSLLLGYLSYRYIEPMRRLRAARALPAAILLGTGAAVLMGVSALYSATSGLDMRTRNQPLFQALNTASSTITYAPECENRGTDISKFCHLNQGAGGGKILVLGDSHAGHLYAWFQAHSKRDTLFYVKSGCPAIPGFERVGQHTTCSAYSEAAYRMAASGTYQTIIVSQNWTGFSPQSSGICSQEGGSCVTPLASSNPSLPVERMRTTLQDLLDRQIKVVVVDATPYFHFNVPRMLERQLFWHGVIVPVVEAPAAVFENNVAYDRMFSDLKVNPGFALIKLRSDICQDRICMIFDERSQLPVFVDKDHIHPAWLVRNGQQFLPFVAPPPGITARSP